MAEIIVTIDDDSIEKLTDGLRSILVEFWGEPSKMVPAYASYATRTGAAPVEKDEAVERANTVVKTALAKRTKKKETSTGKQAPKTTMVTLNDMKTAAKKVAEKIGDASKVREVIAQFGVKLSAVPEEKYLDLLDALDELGG